MRRGAAIGALALFFSLAGTAQGARFITPHFGGRWQPSVPMQTITIVNDADVPYRALQRLKRALLIQADRDLRPIWHTPLIAFGPGGWPLTLTNSGPCAPDEDGCHGYGSAVTTPVAFSYTKINGWTAVASHELVEMLVNPYMERIIADQQAEVCDPVSAIVYTIHGVAVSDFVTPRWFTLHSGPKDFEGFLGPPTATFLRTFR